MPRTPTIFLNNQEWKKLDRKRKELGKKTYYATVKAIIIEALKE